MCAGSQKLSILKAQLDSLIVKKQLMHFFLKGNNTMNPFLGLTNGHLLHILHHDEILRANVSKLDGVGPVDDRPSND